MRDMFVFDLSDLERRGLRVICSTYGHGESPSAALKFHYRLVAQHHPVLTGAECALFAIGDSNDQDFSRGGGLIDGALTADGPTRKP